MTDPSQLARRAVRQSTRRPIGLLGALAAVAALGHRWIALLAASLNRPWLARRWRRERPAAHDATLVDRHQALQESNERLRAMLRHAADGIITFDESGVIDTINPAAKRIFLTSAVGLEGSVLDTFLPEWRSVPHDRRQECRGLRRDGSEFPLELTLSPVTSGTRRRFVATVRDLTDSKHLEQMSLRLGRILEHTYNEIYVFDAESLRLVQASEGAAANLGYPSAEMQHLTLLDLMPGLEPEQFAALARPLRDGEQKLMQFEAHYRRQNGSQYPVDVRLQLLQNETPPVFVAIAQDITPRKSAEERLVYLANYDGVTDLPNRTLLNQRLAQTLEEADRNERLAAVMFIDLDRFKMINDTLGHEAGDELLRVVAKRLAESVRPGDTVARYGGDEFVVLLANVAHVDDVTGVANKILHCLVPAIPIAGRELFVTPSIGITLYPFDDRRGMELLRNADAAMFSAKEQGGNTYRFYTAELNARAERYLTLETSLRQALERGEFLLHYQPQIDTRTGEILGAEALLRWNHPEWGMVSPAEFIPLAEETGLILPIGAWVLEEACREAGRWQLAGQRPVRVAVNLSGRQLAQARMPERLRELLARCRLPRGLLEIEITESVLMQDLEQTATTLDALARLGVTVSMDDFGTGYSSLSYLKRLPIDVLKVDQAFVRDLSTDPDDAAIVQAIIAMAHSLGIKVIAEGVETADQLAFLEQRHCDALQGYYFSRPLPAIQFRELLQQKRSARIRSGT